MDELVDGYVSHLTGWTSADRRWTFWRRPTIVVSYVQNDPYLWGKSSFLTTFIHWTLSFFCFSNSFISRT